jgi:5-formyltetrahydrofolate cyclo-ligase
MPEKKELRSRFLKMRRSLSRESVEQKSYRVIRRLAPVLGGDAKSVMLYVPINHEVDLIPLARDLFLSGRQVLFPRLINDRVVPYVIRDLFFDFRPGAYNIPEPDTEPWKGKVDVALVPGVVFGQDGYRIGYGKGYYDRYLSLGQVRESIGVCYDFQLMDSVPHSEFDVILDRIVCESDIIRVIR